MHISSPIGEAHYQLAVYLIRLLPPRLPPHLPPRPHIFLPYLLYPYILSRTDRCHVISITSLVSWLNSVYPLLPVHLSPPLSLSPFV